MAEKFDIAEHIKVDVLGSRTGTSDGLGNLTINEIVYDQENYSITPVDQTSPVDLDTLMTFQSGFYNADYQNVYVGSTDEYSTPSSASSIYWKTKITGTIHRYYNIYIKDISAGFNINDDPKTSGSLFATVHYPTGTPVPDVGYRGFNPGYGKYQVSVYSGTTTNTTTLVGKFISHIYHPQFDPFEWEGISLDNSFCAYAEGVTNNTGSPKTYSIYINDIYSSSVTVPNGSSDILPAIPPALDTYFNVKVIRDDNQSIITQKNNLKVKIRDDYKSIIQSGEDWPHNPYGIPGPNFPAIPARLYSLTNNSAELFWNIEYKPDLPNWPTSGVPENYYIKVYGSDGSYSYYKVAATSITFNSTTVEPEDFYVILDGVSLATHSYLIDIFFEPPGTTQQFLYYTVTSGANPPDRDIAGTVIAYGWWPVQCSVASADITQSYDIEKALLKRPEPGTCNLTMKGEEGDPRVNTAIAIDAKIRIYLAAAASPTDDDEYLFSGFIESISTTYDTRGNAITSINAVDSLSKVLNVNIPIYEFEDEESFSRRMFNVFENYIGPATLGVTYDPTNAWEVFEAFDRSVFPPEYRENVSASEIINELTEGEYAILAQNSGGVIYWYSRGVVATLLDSYQELTEEVPSYGFSTVHDDDSLDHFCISDFTIRNSIEDITNKVNVSLTYDELTAVSVSDSASIAKYGERAYEVQLNLDAPDGDPSFYIQRWADEVPQPEDQFELDSVTTNVVNKKGYVTNAFELDVTVDPARVYIDVGPVSINGVWLAKRISHTIRPESWIMDIDLTVD